MANDAFYRCGKLTSVTISSNIKSITSYAFGYCTNLTSVVIPENLTSIANNAFYTCFRLPDVTIPNTVTNIGNAAFASCGSLTNVNIPASVRTVDQSAFDSCTNLVKATVGKGVIGIQSYVFARCAKLPSIGDYAFYQCGSLTNVTLPGSVTNIGIYAFGYCSNLVNVTIPESVVRIADFAFSGCYSLAGAYFRGDAPSFGNPSGTGGLRNDTNATVYYLLGTTGWDQWVSPPPAVLWDPRLQSAGVQASQFGFVISGTANIPIVVEAATDLATASWTALQACTLTNGMIHFSDTQWANYPARFYRIRSP
jgi:hypothetical protein